MKTWQERAIGFIASEAKPDCGHTGGCGCSAYTGCCTECPLPPWACDLPPGLAHKRNALRDIEIRELRQDGVPVQDIADMFSMSERNTHRILAGG